MGAVGSGFCAGAWQTHADPHRQAPASEERLEKQHGRVTFTLQQACVRAASPCPALPSSVNIR